METTINQEVLLRAIKEIGQREVPPNLGFEDKEFEERMKAVGFVPGNAWCALFTELIWEEAYQNWDATLFTRLKVLFNASAVTTFRNFQKTKDFIVDKKFEVGCLVAFQTYKEGAAHWTGHIAIGKSYDRKTNKVTTIDGNTNDAGGREGIIVAEKSRTLNFDPIQNGLVCLGFVHLKQV